MRNFLTDLSTDFAIVGVIGVFVTIFVNVTTLAPMLLACWLSGGAMATATNIVKHTYIAIRNRTRLTLGKET